MTASLATDMQQTTLQLRGCFTGGRHMPNINHCKTQHLWELIVATLSAFSIFKGGGERVWVRDSDAEEKQTPGILLLSGWSNASLLHAFHMWKHFMFPSCVCLCVCSTSLEETRAVRRRWSLMKTVNRRPTRAFTLQIFKKKKRETKKSTISESFDQISSHGLSLPWTHDRRSLLLYR